MTFTYHVSQSTAPINDPGEFIATEEAYPTAKAAEDAFSAQAKALAKLTTKADIVVHNDAWPLFEARINGKKVELRLIIRRVSLEKGPDVVFTCTERKNRAINEVLERYSPEEVKARFIELREAFFEDVRTKVNQAGFAFTLYENSAERLIAEVDGELYELQLDSSELTRSQRFAVAL